MQLLQFSVPPFARLQWGSNDIKEKWEERLKKAQNAYRILEKATVQYGIRSCTTEHVSPQNLPRVISEYAKKGMVYMPIRQVGTYSGFAHTHPPVVNGKPWNYYGVVADSYENAGLFASCSNSNPIDHDTIGKLLGYPDCCRKFFHDVWLNGYIDPIWQEANNCNQENIKKKTDNFIRIKDTVNYENNVMLRYIGIRIVANIPCSHDCKHSLDMARSWIELGREQGVEGLDELLYFLQLPVEWDCLKGIAYISTPLFKIETNSMTCYPRHVVQREGTVYPEEAPKGLKFPWNESWKFQGIAHSCG